MCIHHFCRLDGEKVHVNSSWTLVSPDNCCQGWGRVQLIPRGGAKTECCVFQLQWTNLRTLTLKSSLGGQASTIQQLIILDCHTRTLYPIKQAYLWFLEFPQCIMGSRASSYYAPLQWSLPPIWVWEADMFKERLKTFLFEKAYSLDWFRFALNPCAAKGLDCQGDFPWCSKLVSPPLPLHLHTFISN